MSSVFERASKSPTRGAINSPARHPVSSAALASGRKSGAQALLSRVVSATLSHRGRVLERCYHFAAAELGSRDALRVLRVLGERLPVDENDRDAAFERVRLRSIGVEEELRNLEGGGLSDAEFAKRLGVSSRETVRNYREKGLIFAWEKDSRNLRYPAWQIHNGRLLAGLTDVVSILNRQKRSAFTIANYFLSESEDLDNRRPLDLLRENRIEEVKAHAERYGDIGA